MHEDPAIHRVAVVAIADVNAFDLAIPTHVFQDPSRYRVDVCGLSAGVVPTTTGFGVAATVGLDAVATAGTVVVPGFSGAVPAPILGALREARARGARIASICTGAFALAEAGLLDGLRATTHWQHAARLAARFPAVEVEAAVLYVDNGRVLTSAGMAAGIDLCLHMLAADHGPSAALERARRMVVPVHRAGNQAQFAALDRPPAGGFVEAALDWAEDHLAEPLTIAVLAAQARCSERTFARRVVEATGESPYGWLTRRRLAQAARLLERPDLPVEQVAAASGLGSAGNLRLHFRRAYGTTPTAYRAAFAA